MYRLQKQRQQHRSRQGEPPMRILRRDRHTRCLPSEMSKKLYRSLLKLLTKGFICATRSLEDRFHLIRENGRCFTLQ